MNDSAPFTPSASGTALEAALRRDIHVLAGQIGERNTRCFRQLQEAGAFIQDALADAGLAVKRQGYVVDGRYCWNVTADISPGRTEKEIIVVGAHYDSVRGAPGANDNASGVAALLSLARRLGERSLSRTVRIAAFVNEERPYLRTRRMGSYVYAAQCRQEREPIVAMLSLETIGWYPALDGPDEAASFRPLRRWVPGDFLAVVGNLRSRRLVHRVANTFHEESAFPVRTFCLPGFMPGVNASDHWAFWKHGVPACMITDTAPFRYPFYHQPQDTPGKLSYRALSRVVKGLEGAMVRLASPVQRDE
jgi:Zn-dependent M28 family amino/carboxypeptidase